MDVHEDGFAEVVTTNRFDENVYLSTTHLGKIGIRHNEGRGKFSHVRARFCHGKNIEWRGMSDIILKNGLKISPKRCQLFRKKLQHIGNTIYIKYGDCV